MEFQAEERLPPLADSPRLSGPEAQAEAVRANPQPGPRAGIHAGVDPSELRKPTYEEIAGLLQQPSCG